MRYNRLGKTDLLVSAVGFGTCQLRLVPKQQAVDTLKQGFKLGVNWVHTAPDYEGADQLVAQAISESKQSVTVFSQGYGDRPHFEYLFEETCRIFQKSRLEMFGIACIDDREYLNEPIWEPGGIVDFLLAKKQEGRLGGIFCTTHGPQEYILKLIHSGVFDALMLAYNPLGFHLLSYHPGGEKQFETITETRDRVFSVAQQQRVSLLIMKPLAGGLLTPGKAFPPRQKFSKESVELKARDILRFILNQPGVCSVVPGTASVAEAEENALAGYDIAVSEDTTAIFAQSIHEMQTSLCSRCGHCDSLCSQSLPISWLFRDAYINHYPSETFESIDDCKYFHLHPKATATCSSCEQQTCHCPYGIDIPASLIDIHNSMLTLQSQELLPKIPQQLKTALIDGPLPVQVVSQQIPSQISARQSVPCRLYLHNAGDKPWRKMQPGTKVPGIGLAVVVAGHLEKTIALRHDVPPGTRTHITFELKMNRKPGTYPVQFILTPITQNQKKLTNIATKIWSGSIEVVATISTNFNLAHKIPKFIAALARQWQA
jgi:predicted aldo/keto reductase-like oxidoreductase